MDRGRAGGFITDNNYFGVKLKKKQRREHLERLIKIMTRKAGSSITLDNNPPLVVKALTEDPRKLAKQDHFNLNTEKENRCAGLQPCLAMFFLPQFEILCVQIMQVIVEEDKHDTHSTSEDQPERLR
jgi:hypothetical protein